MKLLNHLYLILSGFLVLFAGWTAAVHAGMLLGSGLNTLRWGGPLGAALFASVYWVISQSERRSGAGMAAAAFESPWTPDHRKSELRATVIVVAAALLMVVLTLGVQRSDLDDAFYAALAVDAVTHPDAPLLAGDPMMTEPGLPLLFPSYRFSSYELLAAVLAVAGAWNTLDVYYLLLPAVMAVLMVLAAFVLGNALLPRHALAVGLVTLLLMLLLGEMHRAPANFSFGRLYQGKAVFVSVFLPTLYAVTHRWLSPTGRARDGWVLACGVFGSMGVTNFGMLAAPMAVASAMVSRYPVSGDVGRDRLLRAVACLCIPLPYLLSVAVQGGGSALLSTPLESAWQVTRSVLGDHQMFLILSMLVIGPVFAPDAPTRWRLAVPPAVLFLIYLNPWLAQWIARYVTSPPVYWRVTWSLPLLGLVACGVVLVWHQWRNTRGGAVWLSGLSVLALLVGVGMALPHHSLRSANGVVLGSWAQWKIPAQDLAVARAAVAAHQGPGRLLAPDAIAGVVSRLENHPRLVSVREHYLNILAQHMPRREQEQRRLLHAWVSGLTPQAFGDIDQALSELCVTTVVISSAFENPEVFQALNASGAQREDASGFGVWRWSNRNCRL